MRILITADPFLPVPPVRYGGIERVIALLVERLVARGDEVALVAHPDSRTPAALVPYGWPPHAGVRRLADLASLARAVWTRRGAVDIVHSFGRLAALAPVLHRGAPPVVQSYQRAVPWRGVERARRLATGGLRFVGCSSALYADAPPAGRRLWRTVYNAVDMSTYDARAAVAPDAPLVFLGRLEAIKGVHHAVRIARAAGRRLVIAGNRVPTPDGRAYFAASVEPHLEDPSVEYIGEVDDAAKNAVLGAAAALLMPIEWEEPFGIVMAEALACGTPVVGLRRGSVPEVVRDGVTGFVCETPEDMVAAVGRLGTLDRGACRADAEARFSADALVGGYAAVYDELVGHPGR
ncbi:MAG: glycosyltransferase [Vicinamibacterales bacterium]